MNTDWDERMNDVVFPALLQGLHVYTGFGELLPGHGIPQSDSGSLAAKEASSRKPTGLPIWQVYLGAKDTQPAIRFLQFVQKVRNPRGPASLVYPTRLQRDRDRGVALIVPLGEGLETPIYELSLAQELQALILNKFVRVIALGRVRPFTTKSPWSLSEHLLMEVYSEAGQRIWTNPIIGMTLEEALAKLEKQEEFQQPEPWQGARIAKPSKACHSTQDCVEFVIERAVEAELSGAPTLGLILRSLALRMMRPSDPRCMPRAATPPQSLEGGEGPGLVNQ